MTKREALAKLLSGETTKIRHKSWVESRFLEISSGSMVDEAGFSPCHSVWFCLNGSDWQALVVKEVEHKCFFNIYEDRVSIRYVTKEAAEQYRNEEKFLETREIIFKAKKEEWIS